ncbi:MAG: inorganic phosphate transporter, partial [Candidatus Eremiobacteraeota bacterium]|nr:inorganic phosphate transporter [Candidatus Eremiobacteraeota bacterium]
HTLIGSIVGVGLANSVMAGSHTFGDGVNWAKGQDTLLALIVSPVVGFVLAGGLLLLLKLLVRRPELFEEPVKGKPPTLWVRTLLVLTCTGVSFAHGSNDGQKGMGLLMLILIGIVPTIYALNPNMAPSAIADLHTTSVAVTHVFDRQAGQRMDSVEDASNGLNAYLKTTGVLDQSTWSALATTNHEVQKELAHLTSLSQVPPAERGAVRSQMYQVSASISKIQKAKVLSDEDMKALLGYKKQLDGATNFIPLWVKIAVATFLGFGTMIGWKRIVITVGERIGKTHMTYAQGASAEIVAYATIQMADHLGLPVSTTHILSSGVAGTMAANRSGLQWATVRNIAMAWVLTLPVCIFLGAMLFAAGLRIVSAFHL